MANEITTTGSLAFAKGSIVSVSMLKSGAQFSVTGSHYHRGTQSIATSAVAIGLGGVTTPGWFFCQNNDATNYVELLDSTGGAVFAKLKPGEFMLGRFGCAAPAAKANVAACIVEYLIIQD